MHAAHGSAARNQPAHRRRCHSASTVAPASTSDKYANTFGTAFTMRTLNVDASLPSTRKSRLSAAFPPRATASTARPRIVSGRSTSRSERTVGLMSMSCTNPVRCVVPDRNKPGSNDGARTAAIVSTPPPTDAAGPTTITASRTGSTRSSRSPSSASVRRNACVNTTSRWSDDTRFRYAAERTRSDASTSTTERSPHAASNTSSTASWSRRTPNAASASSSSRSLLTSPAGTRPFAPMRPATASRRNRRDDSSARSSRSGAGDSSSTPSPLAITARANPAPASASPSAPTSASKSVLPLASSIWGRPRCTRPWRASTPVRRWNACAAVPAPTCSSTSNAAPSSAVPDATALSPTLSVAYPPARSGRMLGARIERSATADWSSKRVRLGTSSRPSTSLHDTYGSDTISTRRTGWSSAAAEAVAGASSAPSAITHATPARNATPLAAGVSWPRVPLTPVRRGA